MLDQHSTSIYTRSQIARGDLARQMAADLTDEGVAEIMAHPDLYPDEAHLAARYREYRPELFAPKPSRDSQFLPCLALSVLSCIAFWLLLGWL